MTPPELFVDTAGWLCFTDLAQPEHERAKKIVAAQLAGGGRLVSTSDVLSELVPLLSSRLRTARPRILEFIVQLRAMPAVEIVHITPELHDRAFALLQQRPDKQWSWVDAASFEVMQERQIRQALTTDRHFEQAGFTVLLRRES